MSSSSSRPKPRPRPVKSANAVASSSSSANLIQPVEVKDDDDMFIRKPRAGSTWAQIKKINTEPVKPKPAVDDDSDHEEESPRRRGKKRKHNDKTSSWQNEKNLKRFLSEDLSDNDSDILILEDSDGAQGNPKRKRDTQTQRGRSRSRSITPPPDLSRESLQTAREVVRRAVGDVARAASPSISDEGDNSEEDTTLLPELAMIRRNYRAQSRGLSQTQTGSSPPPPPLASNNAGNISETVVITVKWQPHPLNQNGEKPALAYKIRRNDSFRDLFESIAEEYCILSENVILSYRGNRFFPSISPADLHMYNQAEIVACDKKTWDHIRKNRTSYERKAPTSPVKSPVKPTITATKPPYSKALVDADAIELTSDSGDDIVTLAPVTEIDSDDSDDGGAAANIPPSQDPVADTGDVIKITIRSGMTNKDVSLTVRQTAKCGAVVKAFLKRSGLEGNYPAFMSGDTVPAVNGKKGGRKATVVPPKFPQLCIDGDRVGNDEEIGNYDLEDGDMVEVVGL
ncbi:hypothetical protein WG66_013959 [Moniliophthora roreri]|nr:hypothetical protein WG66_013959 [Moniliophthora roreri]